MRAWFWFLRLAPCLALALGGTLLLAFEKPALAQVFFRPFGGVYLDGPSYGPVEEPPPPYASRRAVSRIVSEEGYRLVGPLGSRGDQIVAIGEDEDGRRMRFIIDPYEGEVLNERPVSGPQRPPEDVDNPEPPRILHKRGAAMPAEAPEHRPQARRAPQVRGQPGVASRTEERPVSAPHKLQPVTPVRTSEPKTSEPKTLEPKTPEPKTPEPKTPDVSAPHAPPATKHTLAPAAPIAPKAETSGSKPPQTPPSPARDETVHAKPATPQPPSAAVVPAAPSVTATPYAPVILPTVKGNPLLDVTRAEAEKKARKQSPGS